MYNTRPAHTVRRFTLGIALTVLTLIAVPSLVDHQAALGESTMLRQLAGESAKAPTAPAAAQAAPAPAAFSDALAAAPAGAQCNMAAHSCSVPSGNDEALSAHETTVAYGLSKVARSAGHNQRM